MEASRRFSFRRSACLGCLLLPLGCGSGNGTEATQPGSGGTSAGTPGNTGAAAGTGGSGAAAGMGGSGGTGGAGPACPTDPSVPISLTDETNYSFTSTLSIQMQTLKDNTDLVFDWGAVTRDFYGLDVNPATDIDTVLISLWNLTPAELEDRLNRDTLTRNANEGAIMVYPDGTYTSTNLLSFGLLGASLPNPDEIWKRFDTSRPDYQFPQDKHTFLLMAATGTDLGRGGRMLALFNVDPTSTRTTLALDNDSTKLDAHADLQKAKPVPVPAGMPSVTIDWSQMTVNALGNEYLPTEITRAVVAHFATSSIADLERDFLRLESTADGWWSGEVLAGTSIDLGTLKDATGATFPGVDDNGTWLAALFCTTACNNPAPWSITILEPCR